MVWSKGALCSRLRACDTKYCCNAQAFRRALLRQLFQACLTGLAFMAALYFSGATTAVESVCHRLHWNLLW